MFYVVTSFDVRDIKRLGTTYSMQATGLNLTQVQLVHVILLSTSSCLFTSPLSNKGRFLF